MFLAALDHDEKTRRALFAKYSAQGYTPDELSRCYNDKYLPYKSGRLDSAGKVPGAPYDMSVDPVVLLDTCLRRNMVMRVVAPAKGASDMHGLGLSPADLPPNAPIGFATRHERQQYLHALRQDLKAKCQAAGGRWDGNTCHRRNQAGIAGLFGFGDLGAGPSPLTMTCEAIIKGYETNALQASTRRADHAANARARVAELEPFYNKCKGYATVTPGQPVEGKPLSQIQGAEVMAASTAPAGATLVTTGSTNTTYTAPIDWNKVALVGGIGVGVLVLLGVIIKKKRGKSKAA